jgi:enoyl-CoA hydratase
MLTGRLIDAAEAERIGLVLEVVDDDALMDRALLEASLVLANSPMGVRMTKEVMWSALEIPGQQAAIDLENRTQIMVGQTADHVEALRAFLEKRAPAFEDR